MGTNPDGACKQAKKCREFYNGILVAESLLYPFQKEFINDYFNEYIPLPITKPNKLKEIFKKYRFIHM